MSKIFEQYKDEELIAMADEMATKTDIPEDSLLRKVAKELNGNDSIISMLGVGVPLAKALAERLKVLTAKSDK